MRKLLFVLLVLFSLSTAFSATYYVKNDGNDDANGLSDATAWKTAKKVKDFNFQTGDDVYFKSGDEWRETLKITWSGTASNRVIIGTYYVEGGQEKIGIPSNGERAIFRGNYGSRSDIGVVNNGGIPWDFNVELVGVGWNDRSLPVEYITVQDLAALDSAGVGMGMPTRNWYSNNVIIKNNYIRHSAATCLMIDGYDSVAEGNDVGGCDMKTQYDHRTWRDGMPCIILHGTRGIAQNNIVNGCNYEGIGSYLNEGYNIIRDNVVLGARRLGLYMSESSNNIVERNLVVGDYRDNVVGDEGELHKYVYPTTGHPGQAAASITEEHTPDKNSVDNYFRNNILLNYNSCLQVATYTGQTARGKSSDGYFYGNTCIGSGRNVEKPILSEQYYVEAKNNYMGESRFLNGDCEMGATSDFSHNYWSRTPTDSDCRGSGDVNEGSDFTSEDWRAYGIGNVPALSKFYISSSSGVRNKGTQLNRKVLNKADYFDYPMNGNCVFDETQNSYDFYCNSRDSTPDLGAFESGSTPNGGGYNGEGSSSGGGGAPPANSCYTIDIGNDLVEGFAAPYDVDTRKLFFKGTCESDSISIDIGSSDITYLYENSYYWDGSQWIQIKLNGDNVDGSVWLDAQGDATISIDPSEEIYVLSYACKWTGAEWKCGCRDSSCSRNYWNLQIFKK